MGAVGRHAQAWTEFWRDQPETIGCGAHAPEIQRPVTGHWSELARTLPAGSRVLDLACGAGAAARALLGGNPQLLVTGVDFAVAPESHDPRIDILANTRMESLPFLDRSFDAAISQFGFEYGKVEEASRELARVLRPGAPFSFLLHHGRSPIAIDSLAHRKAVEAIFGDDLRDAFQSGDLAMLDRQFAQLRRLFPYEKIIEESAHGLRRLIGQAPTQRHEIWRAVEAALAPELTMLAALEEAAVSPERLQSWLQPLASGFDLVAPTVLPMVGGRPLCWKIEGSRKASLF